MPRRRTKGRAGRSPVTQYTYTGAFAAGKGQINLTPSLFGMDPTRSYTPVLAKIQLCLSGSVAVSAAEPIQIKAYNWSIQADIVKLQPPFLLGTIPKTVHVKFPPQTPTQFGTEAMANRKLLSIYDFGTDSKLGMQVAITIRVREGPNAPSSTSLDELPEKFALL